MIVTSDDYALLEQSNLIYYIKFEIRSIGTTINENTTIIDNLEGILTGGNNTINAESDVRRTASVTIIPVENGITLTDDALFDLTERSKIWLNKNAVVYLGIYDQRADNVIYYKLGTYVFQSQDITFDATNNQMSINISDLMTLLDGTVNGQIGQLTTLIPAYKENPDTGEVISYNVIRDAMVSAITQLGNVGRYIIDDIGEFKAMKQYNEAGWKQYRNAHPLWNNIPYDLDFSAGASVVEIVDALRDIYPNNETFFDTDGVFRCQMIPSMYYDEISIPDYMLQRFIISENTNRDFTTVRNVSEVWGQVLETDFYTEDAENINGVYTATIDGLDEEYKNKDRVAIKVPSTNRANQAINLNGYGNVTIYNVTTEEPIKSGTLEAGRVYVFMMDKQKVKTRFDVEKSANYVNTYLSKLTALSANIQKTGQSLIGLLNHMDDGQTAFDVSTLLKTIEYTVNNNSEVFNTIIISIKNSTDLRIKESISTYVANLNNLRSRDNSSNSTIKSELENIRKSLTDISTINTYNALERYSTQLFDLNMSSIDEFKALLQAKPLQTEYEYKFYLQGQWQVHAMCVLTDGTTGSEMWTDTSTGLQYPLYSMDYFKCRYNCDNVEFMINPESPFTIQKIGVRLAVYSGSEYDAIYTDDLAKDRAHYENWKTARLTDNITLQTILMPFLDVNAKVSYRMQNSDEVKQYIIKNVSHDFSGLTSTITMMTFYPLYESRSTNNLQDSYLSLKGTQNFVSKSYINATSKNRNQLVAGNIVWVMHHGNYITMTIGGIGTNRKIGNTNVNGIPWVPLYIDGADNIDNYLFNNSYRTSNAMVTNRYQSSGQFKYQLTDSKGKVVATGTNDASGCIRFSSIDTTDLPNGNTVYYAKQVAGRDSTITYDSTSIPVTITVTNDGNSRYYECVYEITFTNTY